MVFDRKTYLDELISNEGNGMIKIVTGIRRCGKSFLLFTLYKQNLLERGVPSDHIIEMNLENRRNKKWRNPDNLLEYIDSTLRIHLSYPKLCVIMSRDVSILAQIRNIISRIWVCAMLCLDSGR